MNEQDISNAVRAVLEQMKENSSHPEKGHVCKCSKHKMTLEAANALIEKVRAKAAEMGVQWSLYQTRRGVRLQSRVWMGPT